MHKGVLKEATNDLLDMGYDKKKVKRWVDKFARDNTQNLGGWTKQNILNDLIEAITWEDDEKEKFPELDGELLGSDVDELELDDIMNWLPHGNGWTVRL